MIQNPRRRRGGRGGVTRTAVSVPWGAAAPPHRRAPEHAVPDRRRRAVGERPRRCERHTDCPWLEPAMGMAPWGGHYSHRAPLALPPFAFASRLSANQRVSGIASSGQSLATAAGPGLRRPKTGPTFPPGLAWPGHSIARMPKIETNAVPVPPPIAPRTTDRFGALIIELA